MIRAVPRERRSDMEIAMTPRSNWRMLSLTVLVAVAVVGVARVSDAGPYLFTSTELSKATSQKECGGHVVKVLRSLEQEKRLTVAKDNDRLATTRDSTVHVDCIFVGPNEQRRNQWIFYIAIASTNRDEAQGLLKMLRTKFNQIVRID